MDVDDSPVGKQPTTVIMGTPMSSPAAGNGWIYNYCSGCMHADCSLRLYLKDGVVTNIDGNPDSPTNQGKVCLRAIAGITGLYSPYRVKAPLKRTNPEKGPDIDPKWVEISWDEALDIVAARFKKIREEDSRKLVAWWGWGAREGFLISTKWADIPGPAEHIFNKAFGTPNMMYSRPLCAVHYASNLVHAQHVQAISDLQYCDYLIAPGKNLGPNVASAHASLSLIDALERGMKLVVVDPRSSPEVAKAYRWLPIRPGTDLAFTLAMIHVILYEIRKFDEWSVKNRTNGPYLIGSDGYYVRDSATGKPLTWDPVDSRDKTFDDPSIKDYALEGEYRVEGVTAKPALQLIKEHMQDYTPEWAENITTIPAATIREVTREFVEHARIGSTITIDGFEFPFRPAQFVGSGRGAVSHRNGTYYDLAGKIVNLLVGNVEVPGGITGNRPFGPGAHILQPDEDGMVTPYSEAAGVPFTYPPDSVGMYEFYPHAHATPHVLARVVLDPDKYYLDYIPEAMLVCGANSIRSASDKDLLIEAFRKVPFIVSFAVNFDEMTMMSDIVLPEHHFLERRNARFIPSGAHPEIDDSLLGLTIFLGRNAVKPVYNTRLLDDVLIEIADRVGFLKGPGGMNDLINRGSHLEGENKLDLGKKYMMEAILNRQIKQLFGKEYSFEALLEHGVMYRYDTPGKLGYNYYYWPGNKTRFPIYFNKLKESGDRMRENLSKYRIKIPAVKDQENHLRYYQPIPCWMPGHEFTAPPEYDMWACNWKTNFMPFGIGNTQENAWLAELREDDPYELYVWINTDTAKRKGLNDGDEIWVESRYGRTSGKLKVTELIHPEVVGIPAGYGSSTIMMSPDARKGPYFNALITGDESIGIDPVSGGIGVGPRVKVTLKPPAKTT